ncbi:hypothetical protein BsWGS_14845 [Bradybaena similaris]
MRSLDEIPYHLRLPSAIQQAKSTRELASLDLLGQDFWVSSFSKTTQSSKLILGMLQKSCSEPLNIQRPTHTGAAGSRPIINNLPSKSVSDSSHLMTQPKIRQFPQLKIHGITCHTTDRTGSRSPDHSLSNHHSEVCQDSVHSSSHEQANTTAKTTSNASSRCHFTSQNITNSDTVINQSTREPSEETPALTSITQNSTFSEDNWITTSDFVVHRRKQNDMIKVNAQDLDIYRTDPSNQAVRTDGIQQVQNEQTALFNSLPVRHQHLQHANFSRNQTFTNTGFVPQPKANLYFTTNLDLLELPENSYFTSNLSDRMSDYEDIWRNSCSECDVDGKNTQVIHDPQFALDANNNNNNNSARIIKQKVVRDESKHSSPPHIINTGHEALASNMLGLSALEQARIIAGSASDYDEDESALPDFLSEDKEEKRSLIPDTSLQISTSLFNKCSKCNAVTLTKEADINVVSSFNKCCTCNPETFMKEADVNVVSRFPDLNQQNLTDMSFTSATSDVFLANSALSFSACSFSTPISVNGREVTLTEHTNACTNSMHVCRNKRCTNIHLPSRLDNLSRKKSSSESSLIAASSPPYAEPADAVRLRDKRGRDINIQIRRRSAPSSVTFKVSDRNGKIFQQSKVSQHPELETIFSPATQSDNSSEVRFVFDISNMPAQLELLHTGESTYHENMKPSTDMPEMQKHISNKKTGANITHNLSSLESQYLRKNLAAVAESNNFQLRIPQLSHAPSAIMSPSASRFPVHLQQEEQRASCFSDSSTMQDLMFCTHPQLSVRPMLADIPMSDETAEGAQSEYDNLGCNTSTLSSLGTVYSPPWDTTITTRLIKEVPVQSPHKMLPDMNIRERIEYWQQANNTYYNSNNLDETVSSVEKNSLGNSSSQMDIHQPQQHSSQQPLLQHQHSVHTQDSVIKVHQNQSNLTDNSLQHLNHNTGSGSFIQKEEEKKKRWSFQGIATKRISPPATPQSTDDIAIISKSKGKLPPPLRLSSQCPDVVNCHSTLASHDSAARDYPGDSSWLSPPMFPGQTGEDADVLLRRDVDHLQPLLAQQSSVSQNDDWKTPGTKIREYIIMLSGDRKTIFGSTVENFIQCTVESHERHPQHVMRNVRQFMTGIKNYLVKHGEGELKKLIEMQRNKLGANEILNIDAIIEQALHVCVLKPLKYHIYKLFVDTYSENGALEQLAKNIKYARTKSPQELGVKPGLKLPQGKDMEVIKYYLDLMQRSYSPLQKLQNLLKATAAINNSVQSKSHQHHGQRTSSLGADEFLPMLIHVIVHCGLASAEIEADFMWGLLHPSLLAGEGGYCLTTLSSAVLILKNFEDTHKLSPAQMESRLATMSDMQGYLKIAIPDELNGTITWRTLPVRPSITTRDVCAMVAHKLKVTNPHDYGLFMLFDGLERQLAETDCPQMMKCDNLAMGKSCCFAFKRIDATIAWPKHMKHSTITLPDV